MTIHFVLNDEIPIKWIGYSYVKEPKSNRHNEFYSCFLDGVERIIGKNNKAISFNKHQYLGLPTWQQIRAFMDGAIKKYSYLKDTNKCIDIWLSKSRFGKEVISY